MGLTTSCVIFLLALCTLGIVTIQEKVNDRLRRDIGELRNQVQILSSDKINSRGE